MFCLAGNGTQAQHRVYTETPDGSLFLHSFYPVNITFKEMISCEESKEAVLIAFPFFPHYKATSDSDVAFQMINDDVAETLKQVGVGGRSERQLDSVRARKSKYVCINDNIQNKTDELDRIIHDFYDSFFPYPCQFEKGWSWGERVL